MIHSRHVDLQLDHDAYADADFSYGQTAIVACLDFTALNFNTVCQRQAVFCCRVDTTPVTE